MAGNCQYGAILARDCMSLTADPLDHDLIKGGTYRHDVRARSCLDADR